MHPEQTAYCELVAALTRYWITFEYPPADPTHGLTTGLSWRQLGFGVTAEDVATALGIVRAEWFEPHGVEIPRVREVVQDIDVSTLSDVLRPLMDPPNWRGMWFPRTKPLR